jgi:hypothetical protein
MNCRARHDLIHGLRFLRQFTSARGEKIPLAKGRGVMYIISVITEITNAVKTKGTI